jgi:hypothetical protein
VGADEVVCKGHVAHGTYVDLLSRWWMMKAPGDWTSQKLRDDGNERV